MLHALSMPPPRSWPDAPLPPPIDAAGVIAAARRLKAGLHAGGLAPLLLGRNLALLCSAPDAAEASPLYRAATGLGARVALLRFEDASRAELRDLSKMLGRMYDAIDCGAMAPALVRQIEQDAGVPVYAGLDREAHPARALADLMTLLERCPPSPPAPSIAFRGDPHGSRACAFLAGARQLGFVVHAGDESDAAEPPTFRVDASQPACWTFRMPSAPPQDGGWAENHRLVLQAVLIGSIVRA